MRRSVLISTVVLTCVLGNAQRGTAPPGYYPIAYSGDTYTGTVAGTEDRKITLEYRNKSRIDTFTGVITEPCIVPGKGDPRTAQEVYLAAIPKGSNITAFYQKKKVRNTAGSLEDANVMIGFRFNERNGEKLSNAPFIPCFSGGGFYKYY